MKELSLFDPQTTSSPLSLSSHSSPLSSHFVSDSSHLHHQRSFSPDIITYPYPLCKSEEERLKAMSLKPNQVGSVVLYGVRIVSLVMDGKERLCLAQISNTLLKDYSYNEIHNRRVALGITCVQCTPVQLEILRRAGAMPISSRRCGMITKREAERLCKSFLGDNAPPKLPENFAFEVHHECAWGCRGQFVPSRYNSSRAKCIKCHYCAVFFSPNKFVFHSHRIADSSKYIQPDAANFNSWRRHTKLFGDPPEVIVFAWEDIKAMFNGGSRKRMMGGSSSSPPASPFSGITNNNTDNMMSGNAAAQQDITPKSGKIRKTENRSHEKKPFNLGAAFPVPGQFGFGSPIRPIPPIPTPHTPSNGASTGSPFLDSGFDSTPDLRNSDSAAFAPEKMAFAAAAAAMAAANSGNAKGLSDYLWSTPAMHPFPMSYPFFWHKRSMASLPSPLLFGESPLNCGLPKHPDFFRSSDLKLEDSPSHATSGILHWMEQRRRMAEEAFPSSLGDLNDSVGHSLSSAFRPVIFKSYEAKDDLPTTRTTSKPDHANSPETGCSEVSTTVDRDDPSGEDGGERDCKKFDEAIDLRTSDDVTEVEVEKTTKSQFKDFSVQKIVSGLSGDRLKIGNE